MTRISHIRISSYHIFLTCQSYDIMCIDVPVWEDHKELWDKSHFFFLFLIKKKYFYLFILAALHGMQNISSLTRDQTCTPVLEAEVLITGPPGTSCQWLSYRLKMNQALQHHFCSHPVDPQEGTRDTLLQVRLGNVAFSLVPCEQLKLLLWKTESGFGRNQQFLPLCVNAQCRDMIFKVTVHLYQQFDWER